jgi:Fic family protein
MSQGKQVKVTDSMLAAIIAEIHNRAEKAPPGFLSLAEWEARWKCKRSCAKRYLNIGVKAGLLERIELRRLNNGFVRRAPYYGPARKKAGQKPKR